MKPFLMPLLLMLSTTGGCQQDPLVNNGSEQEFNAIIKKRERNRTLLQLTLNYAALSHVSPTGFDIGSPKKWYILSADIIPQFVIGGDWMKYPIHITARYKVRIFRNDADIGDRSAPVRTPSFMPGATMHFPLHYLNNETKNIKYLSLSFFHHSNGQDGDEFYSDGTINLYNGNFSTNHFEAAYHFRNRKFGSSILGTICDDQQQDYYDLYGRIGYEIHENTSREFRSSFGGHRINLTLGLIKVRSYCDKILGQQTTESYYREKHRMIFNATFIGGERDMGLSSFKKRINVDLAYYWRIPSSPNTSLFGSAGYYGSDTYNIYYQQSYAYIRAGIALGFFVAPEMIGLKTKKRKLQ